jgi:hypothetical protein
MANPSILTPEQVRRDRDARIAEANACEQYKDRDDAEKAIVGAIVALAVKYNALEDLASMPDLNIPALHELALSKGVPEAEYGALITLLTPYKWQLEAVTGLPWAECWDGMKSRWAQWMEQINVPGR